MTELNLYGSDEPVVVDWAAIVAIVDYISKSGAEGQLLAELQPISGSLKIDAPAAALVKTFVQDAGQESNIDSSPSLPELFSGIKIILNSGNAGKFVEAAAKSGAAVEAGGELVNGVKKLLFRSNDPQFESGLTGLTAHLNLAPETDPKLNDIVGSPARAPSCFRRRR